MKHKRIEAEEKDTLNSIVYFGLISSFRYLSYGKNYVKEEFVVTYVFAQLLFTWLPNFVSFIIVGGESIAWGVSEVLHNYGIQDMKLLFMIIPIYVILHV